MLKCYFNARRNQIKLLWNIAMFYTLIYSFSYLSLCIYIYFKQLKYSNFARLLLLIQKCAPKIRSKKKYTKKYVAFQQFMRSEYLLSIFKLCDDVNAFHGRIYLNLNFRWILLLVSMPNKRCEFTAKLIYVASKANEVITWCSAAVSNKSAHIRNIHRFVWMKRKNSNEYEKARHWKMRPI